MLGKVSECSRKILTHHTIQAGRKASVVEGLAMVPEIEAAESNANETAREDPHSAEHAPAYLTAVVGLAVGLLVALPACVWIHLRRKLRANAVAPAPPGVAFGARGNATHATPMAGMRSQAHAAGDVLSGGVRRHHPRTLFTTAPGKLAPWRTFRAPQRSSTRCKVGAASVQPVNSSFPAPYRQSAGLSSAFERYVQREVRAVGQDVPAPSPFVPLADVRLVDDPEGGVWACTKVAAAPGGPPREPARQPPPSPAASDVGNRGDALEPPNASEDGCGLDAVESTAHSVSLQADSVHGLDDLVTDLRVEDLVDGVI